MTKISNYKKAFCTQCHTLDRPRKITPGSFLIELILWLFFIIPGLIYSVWRASNKYFVCDSCGAKTLVTPDSPVAINLLKKTESNL